MNTLHKVLPQKILESHSLISGWRIILRFIEQSLRVAWVAFLQFEKIIYPPVQGGKNLSRYKYAALAMSWCFRKWEIANEAKWLGRALKFYEFVVKGEISASTENNKKSTVNIAGWLRDKKVIHENILLDLLQRHDGRLVRLATHSFRPDIWYLSKSKISLLCGFSFSIEIERGALQNFLEDFERSFEIYDTNTESGLRFLADLRTGSLNGALNSVKIRDTSLALSPITEAFINNPTEFSAMLQVALDVSGSKSIMQEMKKNGLLVLFRFLPTTSRLRLALLLGGELVSLALKDWRIVPVAKVDWKYKQLANDDSRGTGDALPGYSSSTNSKPASTIALGPATATLENVTLFRGGTLLQNGRLLENDQAQSHLYSFSAGRWDHVFGGNSRISEALVKIPAPFREIHKGIILSSRADENWFHWLIETLPKYFAISEEVDPLVPVIVSDGIPQSGLDALRLLTNREIVHVDKGNSVHLSEAILLGPVIYMPDSIELFASKHYAEISSESLFQLRERVLSTLEISPVPIRKIFLERTGGARGVSNARFVKKILIALGFEIIDPAKMTFAQQVRTFSQAKIVVTPGGATMANFVFLPAGAKVLLLVSRLNAHFKIPAILARLSGADVSIVEGNPVGLRIGKSILELIHSDFRVSITKLSRELWMNRNLLSE